MRISFLCAIEAEAVEALRGRGHTVLSDRQSLAALRRFKPDAVFVHGARQRARARLAGLGRRSQQLVDLSGKKLRPGYVQRPPVIERPGLRRRLQLPKEAFLFLHIGALDESGNQAATLRSLGSLRQSEVRLAFLGTGPAEAELRDLCHELRLQSQVIWLGHRPEVDSYLQAADAVLRDPAEAEFTLEQLNAMSWGLPLISPEEMHDVLADAELRQRLAERARQRIQRDYAFEDRITDLECMIYAGKLAQRSGPAALFLDRDGTLIHNVPYNGDPDAVRLLPGAGRALQWFQAAGFRLIVVTNQSGLARGLFTAAQLEAVNQRMRQLLAEWGVSLTALYVCPHHPDFGGACACRKPEPGMLLQAAQDHRLPLNRSLMIGDAERDLEAGRRAGVPSCLVRDWMPMVREILAARCREEGL